MAISTTLNIDDLLGISPQAQINLNRVLTWIGEVNSTVGSVSKELRVVASTAACKAIAAADRAEGDVLFLADSGQALYFSAASVAAEALGPPITVIQPTAGTGRWLALALPPVASVAAAQLAPVTSTPVSGGAIAGYPVALLPLEISDTAGNNDFTAAGYGFLIVQAWFVPDATVGGTSTIQIQTAAGAANVTEAMDISAATVGVVQNFGTLLPDNTGFAANAGLRVVTTGTNVAGLLYVLAVKTA